MRCSTLRTCLLALLVLTISPWPLSRGQETQPAALPAQTQPSSMTTSRRSLGADFPSGAKVAVIKIEGMIYDFTLTSLERRVDRALSQGATVIVIELDTPGGVLTSALQIAKYIKSLQIPTIAWVNDDAYSAGVLIASSADAIVMAPSSATGDCAPIVPGQNLEPTERAKALSPLLAEFRDSADQNHYDFALFHAMCVLGVEVFEVCNKETEQVRLVNQVDYRVMVQGLSPKVAASGTDGKGWLGLGGPTGSTQADPGAAHLDVATEADRGQWDLVRKVHDGNTLLTLTQSEAVEVGLARSAKIRTEADLKQFLGAAMVFDVEPTWSEGMAGWLTSPAVRAILIVALLLGAYVEFQTPGLGLPGLVAALALAALVVAPFLVGLAEIWHLLLVLVGFILLMIEIFVTPGFGVLGVSGILMIIMGMALAVVPSSGGGPLPLPDPAALDQLEVSALWTLTGIIASVIGAFFLTKNLRRVPGLNRLILTSPTAAQADAAVLDGAALARTSGGDVVGLGALRVGERGVAVSPLRPAGQARFGERLIDVVTPGQWVRPGQSVVITEVEGNRVVVEPGEPA
ncbi:MAG: hypothetical protein IT441_05650 [Phycisphaeraceae bacterium]|nr:hypothetical protein [Phycisphaeraceae bacterium]